MTIQCLHTNKALYSMQASTDEKPVLLSYLWLYLHVFNNIDIPGLVHVFATSVSACVGVNQVCLPQCEAILLCHLSLLVYGCTGLYLDT